MYHMPETSGTMPEGTQDAPACFMQIEKLPSQQPEGSLFLFRILLLLLPQYIEFTFQDSTL